MIVGVLESTIDFKKMYLMQLERLLKSMEHSYAMFEEGKKILQCLPGIYVLSIPSFSGLQQSLN